MEGHIIEMLLLGIIELTCIIFGMTIVWKIPFTFKYMLEVTFLIITPTLIMLSFFEQTYAIIGMILIKSFYFPFKTKSFVSLVDLYLIIIGGIIMDHLSQVISGFIGVSFKTISFVVLYIMYCYLLYLFRRHILQEIKSTVFIMLLIVTLLTMSSYYIFDYLFDDVENSLYIALTIQIVYFICLLFMFYIVIKNMKKEHLIAQKAIEVEQFSIYMTELEQVNRDMHKFRHDYNNILLTIQGYLQDNQIEELKAFFQREILQTHKYTLSKSTIFNNLEHIQNRNVKGLLAAKILQAQERDIELTIEIPEPLEEFKIDSINLVRVLGIFLDNAIEQCEIESNKKINFAALDTEHSTVFVIQNPVSNSFLSISDIYKKGVSSKGPNRGLGLFTAKALINQQPNCTLHTRIEHFYFIQELEILK